MWFNIALQDWNTGKDLTHLWAGKSRYRTTSLLLDRFNRRIRARDRMGTAWTVHNLISVAAAECIDMNHLNGNATVGGGLMIEVAQPVMLQAHALRVRY